jgi:hypothetical protein
MHDVNEWFVAASGLIGGVFDWVLAAKLMI